MDWFDDWALTLAVFLPLVGHGARAADPAGQEPRSRSPRWSRRSPPSASAIGILADFDYDAPASSSSASNKPWIDIINSRYHLGIDGISLPLLILSMLDRRRCASSTRGTTSPSRTTRRRSSRWCCCSRSGMNGTFVAQDLILFFIFFEVVLLPMFFMIGVWGGPNREYASIKFFLFTLFGSALMLVSFLAIFFLSKQQTFDIPALTRFGGLGHRHTDPDAGVRRPVPRLRDQGADVPVPHVAARRAHRSADGRLGAPGRDPAEARHLRLHPHRAADPARGGRGLGAVDRAPRGHRHHLRRALLSRADAT